MNIHRNNGGTSLFKQPSPFSILTYWSYWGAVQEKPIKVQYSTVEWSGVQYSTVEWSAIQYSGVECNTVQWSGVQYSTVEWSAIQYSGVECNTVQYSTVGLSKLIIHELIMIKRLNHKFFQMNDITSNCIEEHKEHVLQHKLGQYVLN